MNEDNTVPIMTSNNWYKIDLQMSIENRKKNKQKIIWKIDKQWIKVKEKSEMNDNCFVEYFIKIN